MLSKIILDLGVILLVVLLFAGLFALLIYAMPSPTITEKQAQNAPDEFFEKLNLSIGQSNDMWQYTTLEYTRRPQRPRKLRSLQHHTHLFKRRTS